MNQTLAEIKPETLALIELQAKSAGVSIDEYLRGLLPGDHLELSLPTDSAEADFEADMAAFAETTGRTPHTPEHIPEKTSILTMTDGPPVRFQLLSSLG
jgi:hypothetical protein